jgi:hypothetical protein
MPWQECSKMDERLLFVARLLEGEKMAVLCREFDISRKTGYKIFSRYKDCGLEGLTDRSRRPYRQGCRLPFQIENLILQLKGEHPVGMIVGQIGAGRSVDELLADYPYLEREDILQALRYAAWRAEEREVVLADA